MSGSKKSTLGVRKAGRLLLLAACMLCVLLISSAQATPGGLDPSFGSGGKITTAISPTYADVAYALARQADGKLVVAGYAHDSVTDDDFALARYNANGTLDGAFGSGGKVTTSIGSVDDEAKALALQQDGKLVAAGYGWDGSQYAFALARYNPNGSLDSSFGSGGKVTTAISSSDIATALTLQPDGKLVVAGSTSNGSNKDFALARYNPNGSLDTSFNGTGKVTTAIGSGDDVANALALQPDGKLVVAGYAHDSVTDDDFVLARYNSNGTLDTSFGAGGKVKTAFGSSIDVASALALQADGKLVAAGRSWNGSKYNFALARYNPNGSLDLGFGSGGKTTTAVGSAGYGFDSANALALQPDGKLVAAGTGFNVNSANDFALARYNANGSLDTSFNGTGKATTAIGSGYDRAEAVAVQPDGKLVAAGSSYNGANSDVALVRYLGSSLAVAKTGSGSGTVTSTPAGISCGSTCSASLAAVPVTLTATPAAGSSFIGWSGDCSGTGICTLTMSRDHAVTARFEGPKTLTLAQAGSGAGTVTSSPTGINCGSTCAHAFAHGTTVTLTAAAAAGSSFTGWSGGGCAGTGTCTVMLDASKSVTATFQLDKTLTVAKTGAGTVTSSLAGIACGSTCSHVYVYGTVVTLTASAAPNFRFAGWSGDCSGTGTCTLTTTTNHSAIATFKPLCVVPNVKGKTLAAAKRAIRRAHCSLGKVTRVFSTRVKRGRVIAQRPKPGAKRSAGSRIPLRVSKGKKA